MKNTEHLGGLVVRGPFACICAVRDEGYKWDAHLRPVSIQSLPDIDSQASLWLDDGFVGVEYICRRYQPLSEPDLHHVFSKLTTHKDIKRFANHCGLLGNSVFLYYPEQEGQPQKVKTGESFQFWKQEIEKMRSLLGLWDFIQYQKKVDGLRIQWHPQPTRVSLEWHFPSGAHLLHSIAHESIFSEKEVIAQLYKGAGSPARYYLLKELQERLKGHVNPQLNLFNTEQMLLVPDSLLSAIYLSLRHEACIFFSQGTQSICNSR